LLGQTLALDYNIHFVKTANGFQGDYSANTVASLQCTSYLTTALQAAPYSLSASSSVGDVLTAANKAVDARGGTVTGDFNSLLGCLNRES
jgi:hypothetical protein